MARLAFGAFCLAIHRDVFCESVKFEAFAKTSYRLTKKNSPIAATRLLASFFATPSSLVYYHNRNGRARDLRAPPDGLRQEASIDAEVVLATQVGIAVKEIFRVFPLFFQMKTPYQPFVFGPLRETARQPKILFVNSPEIFHHQTPSPEGKGNNYFGW
jgi:hypothetical protein